MSRYGRYFLRDTEPVTDGDVAVIGVNARLAPELLERGWVAGATNLRFRRGRAETREGLLQLFDTGPVSGSGVWSDPAGVEWLVLAVSAQAILWRHGHTPRLVPLPGSASAPLHGVQAFGRLLLFRGSERAPWIWDGRRSGSFELADQNDPGDGTSPIPNGSDRRGLAPVVINNRLCVPFGRDRIAVSDLLDPLRYDASLADFNVNDGSDDAITALHPFANNTLLVFKDQSTYAISGVYGDLTAARLDQVNREVGCIAGATVANLGGDVLWLGANGVYRLQQVVQERLQTVAVPVSDPIAPLLTRLNGRAVAGAVAAVLEEYYFLAVPFDGSATNNAILAFNTQTGAWEGVHAFPVALDALHVLDHGGRKRLFGIDYAAGRVCLLYEGREDCYGDARAPIATELLTRAYGLGQNGVKQYRRAQLTYDTWQPRYSISVLTDGVNEERVLCDGRAKSRTQFTVHGRAPYDLTNSGDDHAAPRREDYAWRLADNAQLRTAGIVPEREQSYVERFPVRVPGRTAQIRLRNTLGTLSVGSVQFEGDESRRTLKTHT